MTEQKQQIVIAEACGWERKPDLDWETGVGVSFQHHDAWEREGYIVAEQFLPDYPNDLNAMHEAEEQIIAKDAPAIRSRYRQHLANVSNYEVWHATAAQRAEAFLRTIGKWRD